MHIRRDACSNDSKDIVCHGKDEDGNIKPAYFAKDSALEKFIKIVEDTEGKIFLASDSREIKDVFKPDTREAITQIEADTLLENMDPSILEKNYKIVPEGALAKLRQGTGTLTKKIGDVTVPGVGDVGDVAWGTSAALGTYSTLAQYGVVGSDDDVRGGSGMGYAATDQLGSIEDQGPLIQPWSFDQNISVAQNNTNAQNTWNTSLGFPQGFDPSATPGYGFSYQQWLQQQMAA